MSIVNLDPIADLLTRIRNAQAVGKTTVLIPFSKIKLDLIEILKKESFIEDFAKRGRGVCKTIEITLKYNEDKTPRIHELTRVSRPSQRIYISWRQIHPTKQGLGIFIISTSEGLMTGKECRRKKIGGEAICEIW